MAIAISEPVAEDVDTANGTSYAVPAFTPTANALLVALVFATGTVAAAPTMTGGSLSWRLVAVRTYNTVDTCYMFVAQVSGSPVSTAATFNCAADAATGAGIMIFQVTGHNSFTPIKQVVTGNATAANPNLTVAAMNTNNGYIAGFGMPRNPPTSTPPTSWTETADTGYSTPTSGISGAYRAGGETGTTVTFTSASAAWGMLFVEIWEAALGPQPVSQIGESGFFGV